MIKNNQGKSCKKCALNICRTGKSCGHIFENESSGMKYLGCFQPIPQSEQVEYQDPVEKSIHEMPDTPEQFRNCHTCANRIRNNIREPNPICIKCKQGEFDKYEPEQGQCQYYGGNVDCNGKKLSVGICSKDSKDCGIEICVSCDGDLAKCSQQFKPEQKQEIGLSFTDTIGVMLLKKFCGSKEITGKDIAEISSEIMKIAVADFSKSVVSDLNIILKLKDNMTKEQLIIMINKILIKYKELIEGLK